MSKLLAGRYELVEKIGEGGMAVVYKARCRLLNRYVAIKILRPEFTKNEQFVENFKKESQAAAGLQHPNIVSVYDVGREGNIHFIVMELIDGRPLSDIIEEKAPLDYKVAIDITRQIASALSLAHKNNIIHRDVKPHNIMITKDGTAKLADFGIAKAISDSPLASETSKIIGSVHYFSPEQARGSYVDERSDLYSLGIVLYEMLTGQVPFDGDNPVQVALMHINDDMVPPSKLVPGIPPALEKLVMKATDKFQTNRYRSAEEMLEDLDNIEFVTKMVGDSIFAASDVEEFRNSQRSGHKDTEEELAKVAAKPKKKKTGGDPDGGKNKKLIIGIVCGVIAVVAIVGAFLLFGGKDEGIKVPDLKNMTYEDAEKALSELELEIKLGDEVPSKDVEAGLIASQTPTKGSKVEKGETVTVNISSGNEKAVVPQLVGKYNYETEKDVIENLLSQFHYKIGKVTEEDSEEEKGMIIEQTPSAGSEADEDTKIDIVISKGPEQAVPNLIGKMYDKESIKALLKENNCVLGTVTEEENDADAGMIIDQSPSGGSEVKGKTEVNITVSKGSTKAPVPNVLGMSESDAKAALESCGFSVTVTYEESEAYAEGVVMYQQYAQGERIEKGSTVAIQVSSGAPQV